MATVHVVTKEEAAVLRDLRKALERITNNIPSRCGLRRSKLVGMRDEIAVLLRGMSKQMANTVTLIGGNGKAGLALHETSVHQWTFNQLETVGVVRGKWQRVRGTVYRLTPRGRKIYKELLAYARG